MRGPEGDRTLNGNCARLELGLTKGKTKNIEGNAQCTDLVADVKLLSNFVDSGRKDGTCE